MVTVPTSSPQILAASGAGAVCIPDILRVIRVLGELMEYVGAYLSIVLLRADTGAAYENGVRYMRTVALFYPLCFAGNAFAGHFSGCGQVSIPLIGAITHITLRVILSWLLISMLGLYAVAIATGARWALVNLLWAAVYL